MSNLEITEKMDKSQIELKPSISFQNQTSSESIMSTPEEETRNDSILSNEKKNSNEDILVEKTIKKWLNLQKIIKEEITLEEVIIKQQQDDTEFLKKNFAEYYKIKLNTRKNWNDIKKLKIEEKQSNLLKYNINQDLGGFHDASEPVKNLFFILRDNYDYLTRLLSLISPEDYSKNIENINSIRGRNYTYGWSKSPKFFKG